MGESPPCLRMKKLIALITLTAMQATPAMAWVGGPWSGNTPDSHTEGLFGGTITMRNGSGMFRFTSFDTAQLGIFSTSMIYYKGITFLGSCQANIDFDSKDVFGITNGSAYNRSPAAVQQRSSPLNDNNPAWEPGRSTRALTTVAIPVSPIVNGAQVTPRITIPVTGGSGPVGIANTSWEGKITRSSPNVRFKCKGEASFIGDQPINFRIAVTEEPPLVNDPAIPLIIPGNLTGVQVDTGGNDPFPTPRNREKIRVYGSRLSYNVSASVGGQNGGLDGTGGGGFAF